MTSIYVLASLLPCKPPVVHIAHTVSVTLFWLSGIAIVQISLLFLLQTVMALLQLQQIQISKVAILLVERLIAWEIPCVVLVAIADIWPDKASYASLPVVLLCGVSVAILNTLLIILFKKDFDTTDKEAARMVSLCGVIMISVAVWLNFASIKTSTKQVFAIFEDMAATFHTESEQYQQALNECDLAIKLDPTRASTYNTRACVLQCINKDTEAIADASKSLEIEPESCTYVTRGYSYGALGNRDAQMADYDAAIKLNPDEGSAYLYRAKLFQQLGDKAAAAKDLEAAKRLDFQPSKLTERQLK